MNQPHKFKHSHFGAPNSYAAVIYCKYCGHIAYDAANGIKEEQQEAAKTGCKLNPNEIGALSKGP